MLCLRRSVIGRQAERVPCGKRIRAILVIGILAAAGCRQTTVRHTTRHYEYEIPEPSKYVVPAQPEPARAPAPKRKVPEGGYTVRKGDTLWSISNRFGLESWRLLLEANPAIRNPKDLKTGMQLRIPGKGAGSRTRPAEARAPTRLLPTPRVPAGPKEHRFLWPVRGRIVCRFGRAMPGEPDVLCRGIVISVPSGAAVRAAKSGVAFVMNSVPGLGCTVSVDHGDGTVTTYAHNERAAVAYGEFVRQGDTIAYAGSSGRANSTQVLFRIDSRGRPVDPLRFLPR